MFKDYIDDDKVWLKFLQSRLETNYDTLEEKKILKEFIENKKYKEQIKMEVLCLRLRMINCK